MSSLSNIRASTRTAGSRPRAHLLGSLAAAAVLATAAAACGAPAHAAGNLAVCIDKSSPSAAMDRKLAAAVAHGAGQLLVVHEFDGGGDDDGFAIKNFHKLAAGACDLVLGFPIDLTNGEPPAGLRATAPYAHVAFVLVMAPGLHAHSLSELPNGTDVAVTYLTTPNLYFESHPNINADVHTTEAETMATFASHEDRAALLWRPTLMQYLLQHPKAARPNVQELTEPHARWNIVALFDPRSAAAAAAFDTAVDSLRGSGQLAALLAPYATPAVKTLGKAASVEPASPVARILFTSEAQPQAAAGGASLPALYTAAQATAGAQKFAANCAACHGKDLTGMAGPALKGKNFASEKAAFSVGDVFAILSQNMPATQPGSLQHQDYEEIMAFVLQQNGYPAGGKALQYTEATVSKVPLRYHGQ